MFSNSNADRMALEARREFEERYSVDVAYRSLLHIYAAAKLRHEQHHVK
jgi:hypothetical protein